MAAIRSYFAIAALACAGALAQDRPPRVGETADPPKEPPAMTGKNPAPVRKGEPPTEKSSDPAKKSDAPADKSAEPDKAAPNKTDPNKANPTKDERKKAPVKRRAVHQIVDGMERPAPRVGYGPVLHPTVLAPVPALPTVMPPSPAVIGGCMGGTCTDTSGTRYQGGVGTTLLSPTGRLCNNNGATVTCF